MKLPNVAFAKNVLARLADPTADVGSTFKMAATAAAFAPPDTFVQRVKLYGGMTGAANFIALHTYNPREAFDVVADLSRSPSYAATSNNEMLDRILVSADAPSDAEFLKGGPDFFATFMRVQESRCELLHELQSAYFHETGHALVTEHFGDVARINIHFKMSATGEGLALVADDFGCSTYGTKKLDDERQAMLTAAGLVFENVATMPKSQADVVSYLLSNTSFWIQALTRAAAMPEEPAEEATWSHRMLYGARGDAEAFFRYAPTLELQEKALESLFVVMRGLTADDGTGAAHYADTYLAALNHFQELDRVNILARQALTLYSKVPTYGLYGGDEQRAEARKTRTEAHNQIAEEAAAKKGTQ
jgi:hypothetical protein